MKKIYVFILVMMMSMGVVSLSGCATTPDSPFEAYKHKSSAVIFNTSQKHLAKRDYRSAAKDLAALDGLYPFGPYAQQGQLDAIYAYYKDGEQAMALASAERYIRLYPRSSRIDYAYYMEGLTNFEMGGGWLQNKLGLDRSERDITNYESAYASFSLLVTRFPRSPYTQDSLARIRFIRNLLAKHELSVAEFYEKRGAYVGAVNRATYIVQHFQGSTSVIPALGLLVRCDRKLGLQKQASQTVALLAYNYPDSKTYRQLKSR